MRKIYADHQAGMPVDDRVLQAMMPYFSEFFGNPSSIHSFGNDAREVLDSARGHVAKLIRTEKRESIIFTSGATESNNLALRGVALRNKEKGNHIITSKIEHISIINICKYLSRQGFEISHLPVDDYGIVDIEKLEQAITDRTILISIMYANGEIGTIQPVKEIGKIAHERGIYFHVDGTAAVGRIPVDVERENIDLLTISSNDMYGPKGVGALYVKSGTRIVPIIYGGGQERGLRSGSENIPGIVGMGKAAEIAKNEMEEESKRLTKLRDKLIHGILDNIPYSYLNGHPTKRLPYNANMRFSFIEGESLLLSLDMEGVAVSSGSACTSKTLEPSTTLLAIGLKHEEAHGSLVFSLGKNNREDDIDYILNILPGIVKRLRAISPLTPKELREG